MSSRITSWDLSTSDLNMHELGTADEIAKKNDKKKQQVADVFDSLVGQSGHNTTEAWALARLTPNQKQQMILKLSLAADFEAFSDDEIIKVGISQESNGDTANGSFVYISKSDSVTKLKDEIRDCFLNGESCEMVLREGTRGGDIINPIKANYPGQQGAFYVVTGDSDATMLSLGFKERFLHVRLRVIEK